MTLKTFPDLAERKKVWIALSDLFLDTDTSIFHENIVKALLASPYSIAEIEKIMLYEVYPVCRWNLLSIAGEWAGFDEKWLVEKIHERKNMLSLLWINTVGRLSLTSDFGWQKIIKEIKYRRSN